MPTPLSPAAVDFTGASVEIDPAPAWSFFGFTPRGLDEGLRQTL